MQEPEPFVDIHCHLLPGIDDGAGSFDETLAMARLAVADGTETVVATPHQLGSFAHNRADQIRLLAADVQQFMDRQQVPLRVLPGADIRVEDAMVARLRRDEILSLADRGRHLLLELPHELYMPLGGLIEQLGAAGVAGILSHPERNQGILGRPKLVRQLVDAGCLMQLTAGSLTGAFGPQIQEFSEKLLEQGLVHFISTDAHGSISRRPLMRPAFDRVAELLDGESALELCCRNPARVVRGETVEPGRRQAKRRGLAAWIGWSTTG